MLYKVENNDRHEIGVCFAAKKGKISTSWNDPGIEWGEIRCIY